MGRENIALRIFQSPDQTDFAATENLWANERYLKGYNRSIVEKLSKHFKRPGAVLEFGAGIGTLAEIWRTQTGTSPECLEIDAGLQAILASRSFVCFGHIQSITKKYDYIYSSNVLEHIEDDLATLKELRALLRNGAYLALYVPAFMCLYSGHDAAVGHYRRYGRKELVRKLELAGFTIVESYYADCIGFFVSLLGKFTEYNEDFALQSLRTYDRYLYPISRMLDRIGFRYLFGKNMVVVARK